MSTLRISSPHQGKLDQEEGGPPWFPPLGKITSCNCRYLQD